MKGQQFYRFSDSVDQNVTKHSKRREIQEKPNGPKLSEKQPAKNWPWILHWNLKNEEMFLSNTTENYGRQHVSSLYHIIRLQRKYPF